MKDKIKKLIDLKSIITLMLTLSMIAFTYLGIISNELFTTVTASVFTFYFTKKTNKEE